MSTSGKRMKFGRVLNLEDRSGVDDREYEYENPHARTAVWRLITAVLNAVAINAAPNAAHHNPQIVQVDVLHIRDTNI